MCINKSILEAIGFVPFSSSIEVAKHYAIYYASRFKFEFLKHRIRGSKSKFARYSLENLRLPTIAPNRFYLGMNYGGNGFRSYCDVPTIVVTYSERGNPRVKSCVISHRLIKYSYLVDVELNFHPNKNPPSWWTNEGEIDSNNSSYDRVCSFLSNFDLSELYDPIRQLMYNTWYRDKDMWVNINHHIATFEGSLLYYDATGSGSSEVYDGYFSLRAFRVASSIHESSTTLDSFSCGCTLCPESLEELDAIKNSLGGSE